MPVGSGNWFYGPKGIGVRKTLVEMNPPHPFVFEDFLVDVLGDSPYVTVTQSGTATTAAAISATAGDPVALFGGWLAGATDDVDAEIDEIALGGLGTGAGTPWMRPDQVGKGALIAEWGFSVPTALTARQYFAGFSDDPVEGTATNGSLNITGTYTLVSVATDAAGFVFSSLASTPTVWKKAAVAADVDATITVADDTLTQVANTWTGLRVEIDVSGDVFYYSRAARGGNLTGYAHSADDIVTATATLLPMFTAAPTTTTAVPWEIDYGFGCAAIF